MIKPRWICRIIGALSLSISLFFVTYTVFAQENSAVLETEPSLFDPDGYYFPATDLVVAGYKVDVIELITLGYYYNGGLHEKPISVPPSAKLELTHIIDQSRSGYECSQPVISPDTFTIVFGSTPIGAITVRGTFTDKRGQFWNRNDIIPQETVVAEATVTISKDGNGKKSRHVHFTYWQGD